MSPTGVELVVAISALLVAWLEYRSNARSQSNETRLALIEHRLEAVERNSK